MLQHVIFYVCMRQWRQQAHLSNNGKQSGSEREPTARQQPTIRVVDFAIGAWGLMSTLMVATAHLSQKPSSKCKDLESSCGPWLILHFQGSEMGGFQK